VGATATQNPPNLGIWPNFLKFGLFSHQNGLLLKINVGNTEFSSAVAAEQHCLTRSSANYASIYTELHDRGSA